MRINNVIAPRCMSPFAHSVNEVCERDHTTRHMCLERARDRHRHHLYSQCCSFPYEWCIKERDYIRLVSHRLSGCSTKVYGDNGSVAALENATATKTNNNVEWEWCVYVANHMFAVKNKDHCERVFM